MIPYGRHHIDQDDIEAVTKVLKGDWLTGGPVVEVFESELSKTVKAKHAVSCSNGTTALHLAMLSLGIKNGDVVLVPAITFLASANAARYVGADVVFVDVDPTTALMTPETLKDAILAHQDKNLKAIVNVHMAGQCENLEKIHAIAKKHNLFIIEDAAHAIGTEYIDSEGQRYPIGSNKFSDLTTFSFHPVKTIAMGEGGAVTTNSGDVAEKLRRYRSHGMIRKSDQWLEKDEIGPWYYEMHEIGYNYRVSDINCALGLTQLKKLKLYKAERASLTKNYDDAFANLSSIKPLRKLPNSDPAWHLYVLYIDFKAIGASRGQVMEKLKADGIGTQVHYIPVYRQPYYRNLYGNMRLQGSEEYYDQCLTLPLYVGFQEEEQLKVIHSLKSYVQ